MRETLEEENSDQSGSIARSDLQEHGLEVPPGRHVLCDCAMRSERQNERHLLLTPLTTKLMEEMFDTVYVGLQPTMNDYHSRQAAIEFADSLVRNKVSAGNVRMEFGLCCVKAFGSYTMDMFNPMSDLDLSLNVGLGAENLSRENKIKILRKLARCLHDFRNQGGHVFGVQPILRANVPVVKFIDCRSGLECDVSAENKDGILKSELLHIFSSLDTRFRKLCFLMKAWAKTHGINSSKDRTLNSLTIILLVAFHLQTRTPAILPAFSVLLEGLHLAVVPSTITEVKRRVQQYKEFGKSNKESVPQLFNSLLRKLVSMEDFWRQGLSASTYLGCWTSTPNPSFMFVEDFTIRSQNAARAVGEKGFDEIYQCLHESVLQMEGSFTSARQVERLKDMLFEQPSSFAKRPLDLPTVQSVQKHRKTELSVANPTGQETEAIWDMASWLTYGPTRPSLQVAENAAVRQNNTKSQKKKNLGDNSRAVQTVRSQREEENRYKVQQVVDGFLEVHDPVSRYHLHAYGGQDILMSQWNYQNSRRLADPYLNSRPEMLPAAYMNPNLFIPESAPYQNMNSLSSHQQNGRYRYNASNHYNLMHPQLYNRYRGGYNDRFM